MSKHSKKYQSPDGDEMWVHGELSSRKSVREEQVDYIELGLRADIAIHPERYEDE